MRKRPKLTQQEARLLRELLVNQPTKMGVRKSEQKGWSDLPLFRDDQQQMLF